MKSILSDEERCYLCGSTTNLETHHIFFGTALRPIADKHGFKVKLCLICHRDQKRGAHGNREMDLKLKRDCQKAYEKKHNREDWMKIIGRNYL